MISTTNKGNMKTRQTIWFCLALTLSVSPSPIH